MLTKTVKWDITGKCNLQCKHCLTGNKYQCKDELTLDERKKVIDQLKNGGVKSINLLGGEPLVLGNDLFDLLTYCNEKDIKLTFNTNGTLLTKEKAKKLFDIGCEGINVSIDGPTAEIHDKIRGEGTFEKTISNLQKVSELKEEGCDFRLSVNTVLNQYNMNQIDKMLGLTKSLKADKWILLPLVVTGFAVDNQDELCLSMEDSIYTSDILASIINENSKEYSDIEIDLQFSYPTLRKMSEAKTGYNYLDTQHCCMAGTTLGFVNPYGILYPCDRICNEFPDVEMEGIKYNPMSLLEHDFEDIWNQPYNNNLFSFVSSSDAYKNYDPCNRCEYLKYGLCIPCPLYGKEYEKIEFAFCLEAERMIGKSALQVDDNERKSLFKYSGQFLNAHRNRLSETEIVLSKSSYIKKANFIRENIQWNGAELYNTQKDKFYQLNFLGKEIWKNISETRTIEQIIDMVTTYIPQQKRESINEKLVELINIFLKNDMVEVIK